MVERSSIFTSEKLGKMISPAQKVIIFGALAASILLFIYSLIFMTPFSELYQIDGYYLFDRMKIIGIEIPEGLPDAAYVYSLFNHARIGMNLSYFTSFTRVELQLFNHWLFALGFFGLLASLVPLVYGSQKRKIYYKTNLVVNSAVGTFNLYIGIHFLVQLIINQNLVWSQNYRLINAYQTYLNNNTATSINTYYRQSDSNVIFIVGYIIALAIIVFAAGLILLTLYKYQYQKRQPQVDLSKVHINE